MAEGASRLWGGFFFHREYIVCHTSPAQAGPSRTNWKLLLVHPSFLKNTRSHAAA
jgi:hypothetical protein